MARPGRPERNKAAQSFRQLRRFHRIINSDEVFGTHSVKVHLALDMIDMRAKASTASPCWSRACCDTTPFRVTFSYSAAAGPSRITPDHDRPALARMVNFDSLALHWRQISRDDCSLVCV